VARRVYFHIATPKTGTTYLQSILWANREALREAGVLLPGCNRRDHWWSTLVLREDPKINEKPPGALRSWDRVVKDCAAWEGDAVISNELFGPATAEQARKAVESLAPAEVHLVVTARNPLAVLTAAWQELLRYRGITTPLAEFDLTEPVEPEDPWRWSNLDAAEVLSRWGGAVPAEQVHVMPVPGPGHPRDELWRRFAGLVGVDPEAYDLGSSFGNSSMGLVETEVLRRVNGHLAGALTGQDRAHWIRDYIGREFLVPRGGEKPVPPAHRVAECRARGEAAVAAVRDAGYDVVGDLDDLRVPAEVATPSREVTDAEVAEASTELVAWMLRSMRDAERESAEQESAGEAAS
jgi:hypothetical protein